jgi:hypothetical protein
MLVDAGATAAALNGLLDAMLGEGG